MICVEKWEGLKHFLSHIFEKNLWTNRVKLPGGQQNCIVIFSGHLGSRVHGFVHDGIFEGKISLSEKLEDEYHVEPSSDHFNTPKDYHSVIYKASDVHYPYAYGKDMDLNDKTKKWMKEARKLSEEHFSSHERERRSIHHRYKRTPVDKVICPIQLQVRTTVEFVI